MKATVVGYPKRVHNGECANDSKYYMYSETGNITGCMEGNGHTAAFFGMNPTLG